MANYYDSEIIKIAEIIRGASDTGDWGDFDIGMSISEISKTYATDIDSDKALKECISNLSMEGEELSEEQQKELISCFIYCCGEISGSRIDPNQAIWNKYFINLYTYTIPISASMMEINRHSALGGEYKEGIFDTINKSARRSVTSLELRDRAYQNATRMVKEAGFPYGKENIGVVQLVFKDWLMETGKEFKLTEMKNFLLEEIDELIQAKNPLLGRGWERAYEACDVMIWIMHIFSVKGINIGSLLP